MRHFLITRFNDYFPTFDDRSHVTSVNPNKGIEEDWLRKRLEIFRSITLPSVKCQTDQEFTWIIKCHPETPVWARALLGDDRYVAAYDAFEACPSVDLQASVTFARLIRGMTDDREIITTRLDSDDALSTGHMALVKKHIQPLRFFDFSRGIVKNHEGVFVHHKPKVSQFCSYFDTAEVPLTVYHQFHIAIDLDQCLKNQVDWGWMQNNHDTNITNGTDAAMPTFHKSYPYKATTADWSTLKDHYPFLRDCWRDAGETHILL